MYINIFIIEIAGAEQNLFHIYVVNVERMKSEKYGCLI